MKYKIISKFIKDISFEIPDVETFTMLEKEISKYNLNFDIKSKPYKQNIVEVNLVLRLAPNQEVKHKMLTEISDQNVDPSSILKNSGPGKIIKPTQDELEKHKNYLKSNLQKNYFN